MISRLFLAAYVVLVASGAVAASQVQVIIESTVPGPTILVINAPAQDDVAGEVALKQIASWQLTKGRIVAAPESEMGEAIKRMAPSVVVKLESKKAAEKDTSPSTLTAHDPSGRDLLTKLNALLDAGTAPLQAAQQQPLAGLPPTLTLSFITKPKGITLAERIRLCRHALHDVFSSSGMITTDPWTIMRPAGKKIRAAIYAGGGTSINSNLSGYPGTLDRVGDEIEYTYVGPMELAHPGLLDAFDVLIVGGGSGSGEAKAIGKAGAAAIKAFIKRGGGYVASCAGAYLATCNYDWSLKIIDADTVDSAHWARGSGQVDIEVSDEGRKIFGDLKGLQSCRYANGPLLGKAAQSDGLAAYTVLAWYRSDMAKGKNSPKGVMPNTPAIIAGQYGEGRVLCCSPHPEYTAELKGMVPRAVKWAAKRPVE